MPIPVLPEVDQNATVAELIDMVSILKKTIEYHLTNGLDSSNAREFGGWYIGRDSLDAKNGTVGLSSTVTGGNDIRFWAGDAVKESAPFRVYEDGSMVATNATISGNITMSSGSISWGAIDAPLYSDIGGTKPPTDADNTSTALPSSLGINYTLLGDTYIYTGTLNANQINAGTISGNYISGGTISGTNFYAYASSSNYLSIRPFNVNNIPAIDFWNADSTTLPRGSLYVTNVGGVDYMTLFGPEGIQITSNDIWFNGAVRFTSTVTGVTAKFT